MLIPAMITALKGLRPIPSVAGSTTHGSEDDGLSRPFSASISPAREEDAAMTHAVRMTTTGESIQALRFT